MKMILSKHVYDQLDLESRQMVSPVPCRCVKDGNPDAKCDTCEGIGTVHEWELSPEATAAIQDNLRSQGVPLGKIGTH